MRNDHIQELVDMCKENQGRSSVDKLITIFEKTKNVNYAYFLHKYITIRKIKIKEIIICA
jgi:hypothetical protein